MGPSYVLQGLRHDASASRDGPAPNEPILTPDPQRRGQTRRGDPPSFEIRRARGLVAIQMVTIARAGRQRCRMAPLSPCAPYGRTGERESGLDRL
jgi:hypothetical protein